MQLEGSLSQYPLRELIEMIIYSSVKGMLEVRHEQFSAQLYFRDGQPCHAIAGEIEGIPAVGRMFELPDGTFRFFAGSTPAQETIWHDPVDLMQQAEDLARRWRPIRAHIPALTWVPALTNNATARVQLDASVWPILAAVDGQRDIQSICEQLRNEPYDVCSTLVLLKEQQLVTIVPPEALTRRLTDSPAGATQKRGFFERLIHETLEEDAQNPGSRYAPPDRRYVESD